MNSQKTATRNKVTGAGYFVLFMAVSELCPLATLESEKGLGPSV